MRMMNDQILSAVDSSTNQVSVSVDCSYVVSVSLQAVASGTAAGTLKLQFSNDAVTATHWSDIPSATVAVAGAGTYAIAKTDISYQFIRASFTNSSGTGALTANIKTIGF